MRDPEERTRHFIIRRKKEEEMPDESSERRVSAQPKEKVFSDSHRLRDEDDENLKAGFFARYAGRGRRDDDGQAERSRAKYEESFDDEFEEEEEDESKKAPLLVRIFAWVALLAIFFVCGYLGANYFFNWADKKGGPESEMSGSGTEASRIASGSDFSGGLEMSNTASSSQRARRLPKRD